MDDGVRVLHVDDDPSIADLTATFLEREDERITVTTASSPANGMEILRQESIDCIVSDYDMPEQDGLAFLRTVRESHEDLPFVLFTGKGSEEIASEAITAGVTDYVQKGTGTERYTLLAQRLVSAVQRRRAEQELASTQRRFTTLIEHSADIIVIVDEHMRFAYVSKSIEPILGYQPSDLLGEDVFSYVHPEDVAIAQLRLASVLETPSEPASNEIRLRHRDGSWVWIESRARNQFDDPDVGGIVVYSRDISERKGRRRELQHFRSIVEHHCDGILTVDTDLTVTAINEAATQYVADARQSWIGSDCETLAATMIADDAQRQQFIDALESVVTGDSDRRRIVVEVGLDDETQSVEQRVTPLYSTSGTNPTGAIVTTRDLPQAQTDEQRLVP